MELPVPVIRSAFLYVHTTRLVEKSSEFQELLRHLHLSDLLEWTVATHLKRMKRWTFSEFEVSLARF